MTGRLAFAIFASPKDMRRSFSQMDMSPPNPAIANDSGDFLYLSNFQNKKEGKGGAERREEGGVKG